MWEGVDLLKTSHVHKIFGYPSLWVGDTHAITFITQWTIIWYILLHQSKETGISIKLFYLPHTRKTIYFPEEKNVFK